MRIVPWAGSPDAVAKVTRRDEVILAVPRGLSTEEVLDLARLVLSPAEFEELVAVFRLEGPWA